MKTKSTTGGTMPPVGPIKGMAAAAAATPPSTTAPSPPMMTRPRRAGRATQSAVSKQRRGAGKAVLDREPAAETARVHQLEEDDRRLADRQDEQGEKRQADQDRHEPDHQRFGPPRKPFENGAERGSAFLADIDSPGSFASTVMALFPSVTSVSLRQRPLRQEVEPTTPSTR